MIKLTLSGRNITTARKSSSRDRSVGRFIRLVVVPLSLVCAPVACSPSGRYSTLRAAAYRPPSGGTVGGPPAPAGLSGMRGPYVGDSFNGARELNVEALVREVIARNPSLAAMRAAWQAAVQRYPQVTALEDPQFSYGLAPATLGSHQLDVGQRFDLSQRFPWPGKLRARGEAALHEAEAAGDDVQSVRLDLTEAARAAFFDDYFVHRAIEINDVNKDLLLEFQRIAEERYGAGLASKQDALQAEIAHQHLVHRGVVLEHMREVAIARLNTLLNLPPASRLPPPPATVPPPAPVTSAARLQTVALERRPELQAQKLRVRAREADVRIAQLEYFPNLSIMGTYNSLWQETDLRPMATVGINVPIELGRRRAALDEARARVDRARSVLTETQAQVRFQVSEAADDVEENRHVVRLYGTSIVPAAEESLSAARSGYEAATNDFLTLIDAERALMLAKLSYEQGLTDYHKAVARLERAVGGPMSDAEKMP